MPLVTDAQTVHPYWSNGKTLCFLCSSVKKKKWTNHVNGKPLCFLCSFVKKKANKSKFDWTTDARTVRPYWANGKTLWILSSSVKIPTDIQKNPQQKLAADFSTVFITLLNVNICNVTAEGVNNHLFQKRDAVVRMRNTPFFKCVWLIQVLVIHLK